MRADIRRFFTVFVSMIWIPLFGSVGFANTIEALPDPTDSTAYLLPVSAALKAGEFEEAEAMLRDRLDRMPEDALAWEVLGVALVLQADVTGADAAYARATEIDPLRLSAWVKRGDLAEANGDLAAAIEHWKGAIETRPDYRPANIRLGQAYAGLGNPERAVIYYEAVVALETPEEIGLKPDLALAYNQTGQPEKTLSLLAPWDTTDAEAAPAALLALGNAHAQTGETQAALARYEQGLAAAPEDSTIARAMGALLVQTGQAGRAAEVLVTPAAAEPVDAFANLTYGQALALLGRHAEAVTAAERAISAAGSSDLTRQALSLAARSHLLSRDFTAATEATARLVALFPDNADAWREHAGLMAATGQYETAKTLYDDALSRFPEDARLLRGRSIVHVRLDDLAAAAEDAAGAAEAAPTWLEPRFMVGEIAAARGRNAEAEAAFRAALEINPDHWPSMVYLARLMLEARETEEARELAERAVELSGGAEAAQTVLNEIVVP